jgi:hypothetical protein
MGNQPNTSAWFGKCGLSATLILVACGIAAARFGHALQLPATTSRDGALVTLNRYVDDPIPDIVLTGSSMTFRLKEEYFETPRLRNLALAGGSVVTGLQIVAGQRQIPKMVVVETNVLSRPPDQNLVERYSADYGRDGLFLRPVRTAIAAYENWIHAPVSHAQVKTSLQLLLEQAPSNFDNHVYLVRAVQQMEDEDPTPMAEKNVEKLRQLIDLLEQRGARVLFCWKCPMRRRSKHHAMQEPRARSFTRHFLMPVDGFPSTCSRQSCGGPTASISTNDPPSC